MKDRRHTIWREVVAWKKDSQYNPTVRCHNNDEILRGFSLVYRTWILVSLLLSRLRSYVKPPLWPLVFSIAAPTPIQFDSNITVPFGLLSKHIQKIGVPPNISVFILFFFCLLYKFLHFVGYEILLANINIDKIVGTQYIKAF